MTTNFGWPQPANLSTGWGSAMDTMIAAQDGLPHYIANHLVRYVDYANGNDGAAATRGLGPGYAYKTIQAAYTELRTTAMANYSPDVNGLTAVGRIEVLPGDHDVGAGILIRPLEPVHIRGTRGGLGGHYGSESVSRLVSSSSAGTEFIKVQNSTATLVGYGCVFEELVFSVLHGTNTALTSIIQFYNTDFPLVRRCAFFSDTGASLTCPAVYVQSAGGNADSAWGRIIDCNSVRMPLALFGTGVNYNSWVVRDNVGFYSGSAPWVQLQGDFFHSTCQDNYMEGTSIAFQLDSDTTDHSTFLNNSGESADNTNPYYKVTGSVQNCQFIGGITTVGDNSIGTYLTNTNVNASGNIILAPVTTTGTAGKKNKFADSGPSTFGYTIWHPGAGIPVKYKSGSGTLTIADADFSTGALTPLGTLGATFSSTGPTYKIWIKVATSDVWKSVAVT
jgi:hypothetical protein